MLFIQSLNTYYKKEKRSSEYATLRSEDLFRTIDISKIHECEVFAQILLLRYDENDAVSPAKTCKEDFRQYDTEIYTEGTERRWDNFNELLHFIRIFKEDD